MDDFAIIIADFVGMVKGISQDDLAFPLLVLTWVLMVSWNLEGIDCRDWIAGLTYVGVLSSLGILLLIITPNIASGEPLHLAANIGTSFVLAGISARRWLKAKNRILTNPHLSTSLNKGLKNGQKQ